MKPNFALTLSFDGIGLLHRSDRGWLSVGDVPLSDPDLANALRDLVDKAQTLNAGGITTKLVIPNQQIRYLTFESDSRDIDILEAQVRSTLNGATPYHVSELAYDWSMTGGEVCVAAVAIETLTEAESFAVDHGLNPMSFVAVPENGAFQGEPFFGETVHAGEVLTPGDSVERDEDAILMLGQAELPEPEAEAEPEEPAAAEPAPIAGFQSARRPPPPPTEDLPAADDIATDPAPIVDPTPSATSAVAFSSARRAAPEDPNPSALPQGRLNPASSATPTEPSPPPAPSLSEPASADRTAAQTSASPEVPQSTPLNPPATKAPIAAPPEAPRTIPSAPKAPETPPSFAEDRAERLTLEATRQATPPATPLRPAEKPSAPASKHPGRLPFLSSRKADPLSDRARPGPVLKEATKKWGTGAREGLTKARAAASGLAGSAAAFRATSPIPSAADRSAAQAAEDERQRMTVFGARNPESSSTESNPRFLALALTAGLLLFLVGVAAWAALFLEGGISSLFRSSEDVQFAEEPAAIEAPAALPTEADDDIAALPQTDTRDPEELADEPLSTLNPDQPFSEEPSPDEARARYAATGIWQKSPDASRAPLALEFEDVYQTSLDPDVNFSDAVALPNVALLLPQTPPASPGVPLAFGADDVARDARGFVLATPDGTLSPDGIRIFAGAPPLIPPTTPDRPEPDFVEVALAQPEPAADPDSGLRPRARPTDLSDEFERANNGGRTLDELQTLRPRLRPQSAQEQAQEQALAEAGITPDTEEGEQNAFVDATDEAVATSIKPRPRPQNFARIVEETRETAASEPVSVEQRVAVAIPTTASVARAATERNQISLRRVNLIGVYGSPDSRRALVRLPNGRYQKVKVGDRLDGGQVAAIGADELRYIKRGQAVVLKMPRS